MEFQNILIRSQKEKGNEANESIANEEFNLYYEYKIYNKENYDEFIQLVDKTNEMAKWRTSFVPP